MGEPLIMTLKAANKRELVQKLRLSAALGNETRYTMDRDSTRIFADALETALNLQDQATEFAAWQEAKMSELKREVRRNLWLTVGYAAWSVALLGLTWLI